MATYISVMSGPHPNSVPELLANLIFILRARKRSSCIQSVRDRGTNNTNKPPNEGAGGWTSGAVLRQNFVLASWMMFSLTCSDLA